MYVCKYVCMYVCLYVCMHIHMHVQVHIHIRYLSMLGICTGFYNGSTVQDVTGNTNLAKSEKLRLRIYKQSL